MTFGIALSLSFSLFSLAGLLALCFSTFLRLFAHVSRLSVSLLLSKFFTSLFLTSLILYIALFFRPISLLLSLSLFPFIYLILQHFIPLFLFLSLSLSQSLWFSLSHSLFLSIPFTSTNYFLS